MDDANSQKQQSQAKQNLANATGLGAACVLIEKDTDEQQRRSGGFDVKGKKLRDQRQTDVRAEQKRAFHRHG